LDGLLISVPGAPQCKLSILHQSLAIMLYSPKIRGMRIQRQGGQGSHYGADRPWSVNGHSSQGEPTTRRSSNVKNLSAGRLYIKHNTFQSLPSRRVILGHTNISLVLICVCIRRTALISVCWKAVLAELVRKGFKRQSELTPQGYVHDSPSYECHSAPVSNISTLDQTICRGDAKSPFNFP
jgi:hypothetical protein